MITSGYLSQPQNPHMSSLVEKPLRSDLQPGCAVRNDNLEQAPQRFGGLKETQHACTVLG